MTSVEEFTLPVGDTDVDVVLHGRAGESVPVLLTHGAGGDLSDGGLVALAEALADLGHACVRANLPYRQLGRAFPPRAERSAPAFARLAEAVRDRVGPDEPWVVGGKSYGGRVASLAVADGLPASGLVFYGYPLHAPGKPGSPRVEHWPRIDVPCVFLQGTRDPFCDLGLLRDALPRLAGPTHLEVVDGGDHSLHVRGKDTADGRPRPPAEVLADLAPVVTAAFAG